MPLDEFSFGRLTDKLNLVAIAGDMRVRVADGYVSHIQVIHPEPALVYGMDSVCRSTVMRMGPTRIAIEAVIGDNGLVIERYDPFKPVPIGSKVVDDCTNDELLYALQYRLGLVKQVE